MLSRLGDVEQQVGDARVEVRAALDDRARAERVRAELVLVDAGRVGGVRDVDDDRDVGAQRVGRRASSRRTWSPPARRRRRRRRPARRRPRRPGARPRARRSSPGGCPSRAPRRGRWAARRGRPAITATSPTRTSAPASSASRAPMSMCSWSIRATFLRSSSLSRWMGFLPITPGTAPSRVASVDPLADEDLRVPAADAGEAQEAVVLDVGDDHADLVDVAHDRQRRAAAGALHAGPRGAHHVGADLGERATPPRAKTRAGAVS